MLRQPRPAAALRARPLLGLLAVAGLLVGAASPAAADAAAGVVRHGATVSAVNALIAEVRVSLDRAARVYVEYDNPQAGRYRTALSEPGAEHAVPLVRLRPETTYDYTIFVAAGDRAADGGRATDGGAAAGPGGRFTTGALPPLLTTVPVRVRGRSSQPLILSDLRGDRGSHFLFRDETGAVVWYYHEPAPFRSSAIDQLPGGNLLFLHHRHVTEITPLGEVVNRYPRGGAWGMPHHDFTFLGDGRMVYPSWKPVVIDDSANGGAAESPFRVDNLRAWHPESGRIEQVWDAGETWDLLDPRQRGPSPEVDDDRNVRWPNVNSVSIGPRGNVILSLRARDQVVSLSPDFRAIEWQLGGPDSDYQFPNPADRFYAQHTAAQLANGNVLVFDNGTDRPEAEGGRYSRALELRLDAAAGTAVKAWEYRTDPDTYSRKRGGAYRLGNGNTLVTFAMAEDDAPLLVAEVDPAGREVFLLESLPSWPGASTYTSRYRASAGIAAIMGETMLRPPAAAHAPAHGDTVADGFTVAVDLARFRELEAVVAGARRSAVGGPFDLYLADGRLVYAKEPCAHEDVAPRFALHVFPAGADRFDNLDFSFVEYGQRWQGSCLAAVTLPDYAIGRIRTGQYVRGLGGLWTAEIGEFPAGE